MIKEVDVASEFIVVDISTSECYQVRTRTNMCIRICLFLHEVICVSYNSTVHVYSSVESDDLHEKVSFFRVECFDVMHTTADDANVRMQRTVL